MHVLKILIIDDEQLIRWSFEKRLRAQGFQVFSAGTGEDGLVLFEKHYPDIVFVDNKLPGIQGLEVITKIKSMRDETCVVFMTAYGSVDTAVKAMKAGAVDYITKPFDYNEINVMIRNVNEKIRLSNEVLLLRRLQTDRITFDHIIGKSALMMKTIQMAKKIANTDATTVMLLGESGTGKDYFAKAIHQESNRREQPFVTINCSSFAETLLESELFGHEQGAFTDAKKSKKGLFEMAEGGTVFLDEIGDVNMSIQVKLLNVIENRTIRRVGGTSDISIDVRIIAATNKNLDDSIRNKTFREDLYYRLKVFQLVIPTLKEHREDIPDLVQHFIAVFNRQFRKSVEGAEPGALALLQQYNWPGNIRELRNVLERAVILESGKLIQEESLPQEIAGTNISTAASQKSEFSHDDDPEFRLPEGLTLYEIERQTITNALKKAGNNQTKASKLLGITRDTLRYKLKKYDL